MLKMGVFGGTFDPIHLGHLAVAREVREKLALDRILFVPAGEPPHRRPPILSATNRLALVRLAIEGEPGFDLSDLEIRRAGPSFTVDTLSGLQETYRNDELFLILGLDAFQDFSGWREPDRIAAIAHLVVVSRPGFSFEGLSGTAALSGLASSELGRLDSGTIDRIEKTSASGRRLILLAVTHLPISASAIRAALSGRLSAKSILPPAVESYIIKHNLFR